MTLRRANDQPPHVSSRIVVVVTVVTVVASIARDDCDRRVTAPRARIVARIVVVVVVVCRVPSGVMCVVRPRRQRLWSSHPASSEHDARDTRHTTRVVYT
jgi:hypothetical protein